MNLASNQNAPVKPAYKSIKIRLVDFKQIKEMAHKKEKKLLDVITELVNKK